MKYLPVPGNTKRIALGIVAGALLFGAGFATSTLWQRHGLGDTYVQTDPSIRQSGYKYTAPLLSCASYGNTAFSESTPLESDIKNLIQSEIRSGAVSAVSVYYRGGNGEWVGVNENEQYPPASLLKVPLMIAYFKEAETNPAILDKRVRYDGTQDDNVGETFRSADDIKPGVYTIRQLLKAMIVNSDNNATRLLDQNIDTNSLNNIYSDLGLSIPTGKSTTANLISAKQYSYFFRILYNATYLTPNYSEEALSLLVQTDFPAGLSSTVSDGVAVANKFGERTVLTPQGQVTERNLHDCGIVFAQPHPYILCIMTKGKDFDKLTRVIQDIGKLVYKDVAKK